ncbi:hypothetical protein [Streptomyces olivochromogenes]|nr:hypothetical protein [Streptomyces olivochromogenes]
MPRVVRSPLDEQRSPTDRHCFADDGAVGAVVINAARQAVWVCYFNDGT